MSCNGAFVSKSGGATPLPLPLPGRKDGQTDEIKEEDRSGGGRTCLESEKVNKVGFDSLSFDNESTIELEAYFIHLLI